MAQAAGLDLVEVQAEVRPPLVKIMDYGKYRFEQSKRKNAQNKAKKSNDTKEVRLGRSVKIDQHDVAMRLTQARKFLLEGHKVMFVQRFKGREMAHPDIGLDRLNRIAEELSDISSLQAPPKMAGRQMNMLLNPDRRKIDAYKRKHPELFKDKAKADDDDQNDESTSPPTESTKHASPQPAGDEMRTAG